MHRTGFVPAGDAHWWHVSTFERAVVTDMSEHGFRLRARDREMAMELAGAAPARCAGSEGGPGGRAALPRGAWAPDQPGELGAALRPAHPAMIASSVRRAARSGRICAESTIMARAVA